MAKSTTSTNQYVSPAWNPRKITEAAKLRLDKSLAEFGDLSGIVVNRQTGNIIGGNQRIGRMGTCPITVIKSYKTPTSTGTLREGFIEWQGEKFSWREVDWDPVREKAANIAANAHGGEFDYDRLTEPCVEVREAGIDVDLLGFDMGVLDGIIFSDQYNSDGSLAQEPKDRAYTQMDLDKWEVEEGSVYKIKRESEGYVICGDASDPGVMTSLREVSGVVEFDLIMTSPPYDDQRSYEDGNAVDWTEMMKGVFGNIPTADRCQILVNLGVHYKGGNWQEYWSDWIDWMCSNSWRRTGWYVWDQGHALPGRFTGKLPPSFEFIFHFNQKNILVQKTKRSKENKRVRPTNIRKDGKSQLPHSPTKMGQPLKVMDNVLRIPRSPDGTDFHPAIFPVALPVNLIGAFSDIGMSILDPFSGSGTTVIACDTLDRVGCGIDLSPTYVAGSLERMTGMGFEVEKVI